MIHGLTPGMIDTFNRKKQISISNLQDRIEEMEQELSRLTEGSLSGDIEDELRRMIRELRDLEELTAEEAYTNHLLNQVER